MTSSAIGVKDLWTILLCVNKCLIIKVWQAELCIFVWRHLGPTHCLNLWINSVQKVTFFALFSIAQSEDDFRVKLICNIDTNICDIIYLFNSLYINRCENLFKWTEIQTTKSVNNLQFAKAKEAVIKCMRKFNPK